MAIELFAKSIKEADPHIMYAKLFSASGSELAAYTTDPESGFDQATVILPIALRMVNNLVADIEQDNPVEEILVTTDKHTMMILPFADTILLTVCKKGANLALMKLKLKGFIHSLNA